MKTDLRAAIRRLEKFADERGVRVVRNSLRAGVLGRIEERRIVLRKGLSLERELATLAHELTHLLIHCSAHPPINRTVCEYEAEAVECWVTESLRSNAPADSAILTEDLLGCSVARVRATAQLLLSVAQGSVKAAQSLQPQPAVEIDAAAREEVVLHDELHSVRDLVRLAESL